MDSRRVVGWSMGTTMESRLVVDALAKAVQQRFPDAGLVAHSDRGSQYASEHYQRALAERGITNIIAVSSSVTAKPTLMLNPPRLRPKPLLFRGTFSPVSFIFIASGEPSPG